MGRVEKCVPRWFGDVDRIDDIRMAKILYDPGNEGEMRQSYNNKSLDGRRERSFKS